MFSYIYINNFFNYFQLAICQVKIVFIFRSFSNMNTTFEMPSQPATPLQYTPILSFMSDKQLALFVPFVVYWIYSGFYHLISIYEVSFFEKYRIHSLIEVETRNKVSMGEVVRAVLLQQFLQTLFGLLLVVVDDDDVLLDDEIEMLGYQQTLEATAKIFGLWNLFEPYQKIIIETSYWYLIPLSRFLFAM
jgi:sphinganine C4-monooxygenase